MNDRFETLDAEFDDSASVIEMVASALVGALLTTVILLSLFLG